MTLAFTWGVTAAQTVQYSPVFELTGPPGDGPIQLDWTSESLTEDEPFVHYDFQIETSTNLTDWTPVGEFFTGGFLPEQTLALDLEIPTPEAYPLFVRLAYQLHLPGEDLSNLNFEGKDLRGANFQGSDLSGASFAGALLDGADLSGAQLDTITFGDASLLDVNWGDTDLLAIDIGEAFGHFRIEKFETGLEEPAATGLPRIPFHSYAEDMVLEDVSDPYFGISKKHVVLMLEPEATLGTVNALLEIFDAVLVGSEPADEALPYGLVVFELPTTSAEELLDRLAGLSSHDMVATAAPDVILSLDSVSDDSNSGQWTSTNSGKTYTWKWEDTAEIPDGSWGLKFSRVPQMWNTKEALEKVKADAVPTIIMDGGFPNHPDLELAGVLGSSSFANPDHGLHVAGIIAAKHDNNEGIDGVNPFARLVGFSHKPVLSDLLQPKTISDLKSQALSYRMIANVREALKVNPRPRIISMSLGGNWIKRSGADSVLLFVAEKTAEAWGPVFLAISEEAPDVLFTVSAGNDGELFPSEWNSPMTYAALELGASNVLVVESHGPDGSRSDFSSRLGHISAPGEAILSLSATSNQYIAKEGTSQATPFLAGVAGYLLAVDPSIQASEMKSLLLTGGFNVDAYAALLEIDNRDGRDRDVLGMLLDLDDGTLDGNLRIQSEDPEPGIYRSFSEVEGGEFLVSDFDGDGGIGDGDIDMADFRRWRDWLIHGERIGTESSEPHGLNGPPDHPKFDANRDGRVELGMEAEVYPMGDFNGDGILDRGGESMMYGTLGGQELTDLQVFIGSDLFKDDQYEAGDLPDLVDSVDVLVSMVNVYADPLLELGETSIKLIDADTDDVHGNPRTFKEDEPTQVFTIPVGKKFRWESDRVELPEDSAVQLRSPEEAEFSDDQVGGDFVADLAPVEMTARAYVDEQNLKEVVAEPTEKEVDAWLQGTAGIPDEIENSEGARAMANEEATMWAVVRSAVIPGGTPSPDGNSTYRAEVVWRRSFVKQEGAGNPEFEVKPMRLMITDGLNTQDELRAFAELKLELRQPGGEWEEVFYTMAEIAGYSQGIFGPDTFELVAQEGDVSGGEFTLIESGTVIGSGEDPETIYFNIGAEYEQPGDTGEVDISAIPDGVAFELRYNLKALGISPGPDTIAEAVIGDPLDYPSGVQMAYGDFGELSKILSFAFSEPAGAEVAVRSREGFVYTLVKRGNGESGDAPVAVALGKAGMTVLKPSGATAESRAEDYVIDMRPFAQARDADEDGIDDAYELQRNHFLDPLHPGDANEDEDGDTFTNLAEYQQGTDPEVFDAIEEPGRERPRFPGRVVQAGGGTDPQAVDLNQDGRLDFLSLSGSFQPDLRANLANPDTSFQEVVLTSVGEANSVIDLAIGNLNEDSFPDAVLLDGNSKTLLVYTGDGDGTFSPGLTYDTVETPSSLRVVEMTGDGLDDILLLLGNAKTVSLVENMGGDSLAEMDSLSFDSNVLDAGLGFVNGDERTDLVVSLANNDVAVLLATDLGFDTPQFYDVGTSPSRLAVGDINGDGLDDVVTANKTGHDVSLLLTQEGTGLAAEVRVAVGQNPSDLVVRELTGDDFQDVLISHNGSNFHVLLEGNAEGIGTVPTRIASSPNSNVLVGDYNQDNLLDLVGSLTDNRSLILAGLGDGNFDTRLQISFDETDTEQVEWVQFDDDPALELMILNGDKSAVDVWDDGFFESDPVLLDSFLLADEVDSLVSGDFDGNGTLDAVATSRELGFLDLGSNELRFLSGDGLGGLGDGGTLELNARPSGLLIAELGGNERPDLVLPYPFEDAATEGIDAAVALLENDGNGQFTESFLIQPDAFFGPVTAGDLNGDGIDEVILGMSDAADPHLRIYQKQEDDSWLSIQELDILETAALLIWQDMDGDMREELLIVTNRDDGGKAHVLVSAIASGSLSESSEWIAFDGIISDLVVADLDGDDHLDGVINGDTLQIYDSGSGLYEQRAIHTGGTRTRVLDLNGDSRLDILSWSSEDFVSLLKQKE